MSAKPKSNYTGRGVNFQIRLSDDEHRDFDRLRKAGGFPSLADYFRAMLRQAERKVVVAPAADPIRPENRDIHKRLESLWNQLAEHDRTMLEKLLEAYSPKLKGKRAS
jgi:Arc/MetJ-type ribon-helix-helix transcriptional regulator